MKSRKQLGRNNQKQGIEGESFVINKLKQNGWIIIPTQGSKSPLDLLAHNPRKKQWWGIQVKSTNSAMSFDPDSLTNICRDLHFIPVLAHVKATKPRDVQFCMKKNGRYYHVFENGQIYHPIGEDWDCMGFQSKISIKS